MDKIEFVFMNNYEFDDPYYQIRINGFFSGTIDYYGKNKRWMAKICINNVILSSDACFEIGLKIEDLNESLARQRKEYFGLI